MLYWPWFENNKDKSTFIKLSEDTPNGGHRNMNIWLLYYLQLNVKVYKHRMKIWKDELCKCGVGCGQRLPAGCPSPPRACPCTSLPTPTLQVPLRKSHAALPEMLRPSCWPVALHGTLFALILHRKCSTGDLSQKRHWLTPHPCDVILRPADGPAAVQTRSRFVQVRRQHDICFEVCKLCLFVTYTYWLSIGVTFLALFI